MKAKSMVMATLSGLVVLASALPSHAKSSMVVRFHLESSTDYVEQSAGVFIGQMDNEKFSLSIEGVDQSGKLTRESFGPEEVKAMSTDRLTIEGNTVTSDTKEGRTVVRADVNNESEIRVSSSEMLRVMSESLKAKGKNLVTNLDLQSADGEAAFKLNVSDLVCKKSVPMICSISVDMMIRAEK